MHRLAKCHTILYMCRPVEGTKPRSQEGGDSLAYVRVQIERARARNEYRPLEAPSKTVRQSKGGGRIHGPPGPYLDCPFSGPL